ncbi:hypothetical protein ACOSQ3_008001 [Xanthoceras sorbifolium]
MRLVEDLMSVSEFPWDTLVYSYSIKSFTSALNSRAMGFESRQMVKGKEKHPKDRDNVYGFTWSLKMRVVGVGGSLLLTSPNEYELPHGIAYRIGPKQLSMLKLLDCPLYQCIPPAKPWLHSLALSPLYA